MCWQKIPCEYFLSHIFHAKRAREERALRENWLRFLLLLLLLLLFLLLVVAVVAGGPLDPDYVPAQYPPGIRTEGFIPQDCRPSWGRPCTLIEKNRRKFKILLILVDRMEEKSYISEMSTIYDFHSHSTHQQIFIEFTFFIIFF